MTGLEIGGGKLCEEVGKCSYKGGEEEMGCVYIHSMARKNGEQKPGAMRRWFENIWDCREREETSRKRKKKEHGLKNVVILISGW